MNNSKKMVHLFIAGLCLILANPFTLDAMENKKEKQCSEYCWWKQEPTEFKGHDGTQSKFSQRIYHHLSDSTTEFATHYEFDIPLEIYESVHKKSDAETSLKVQHSFIPGQEIVLVCNDGKKLTISPQISIQLQSLKLVIKAFGNNSHDEQIPELPLHEEISSWEMDIIIQCLNITVPEPSNFQNSQVKKTKAFYRWLKSCCSHNDLDHYKNLLSATSFLDIKELKWALYILMAAKLGACTDRDKPFAPYAYNGELLEPSVKYHDEENKYEFLCQNFNSDDVKSMLTAFYMINNHQLCPNHFLANKVCTQFVWHDLDMDRDLTDEEALTLAKQQELLMPEYPHCPARKRSEGYYNPSWE